MLDKEIGKPTHPLCTTCPEKYLVHAFLERLINEKLFAFVSRKSFLIKFTSGMFLFVRAILVMRNSNNFFFFLAKLNLPSRVNFVQLSFNFKVSNTHLVTKTIDFSHKNWLSL